MNIREEFDCNTDKNRDYFLTGKIQIFINFCCNFFLQYRKRYTIVIIVKLFCVIMCNAVI